MQKCTQTFVEPHSFRTSTRESLALQQQCQSGRAIKSSFTLDLQEHHYCSDNACQQNVHESQKHPKLNLKSWKWSEFSASTWQRNVNCDTDQRLLITATVTHPPLCTVSWCPPCVPVTTDWQHFENSPGGFLSIYNVLWFQCPTCQQTKSLSWLDWHTDYLVMLCGRVQSPLCAVLGLFLRRCASLAVEAWSVLVTRHGILCHLCQGMIK